MIVMTSARGFALTLAVLGLGVAAILAMIVAAIFWLQQRRRAIIPAEAV